MARGRDRGERRRYEPTYEGTIERADRRGSLFDNIVKGVTLFRPHEGENLIRILPPGWEDPEHHGYYIKVHNNVGPRQQKYLCPLENSTSPHDWCPLCDEFYRLGARATQDDRKVLGVSDNVLFYIIDRDTESEGPKVWVASGTTDSEIAAQSVNRRNHSILNITDPEDGFDISFQRTGTGMRNTRYRGFQVVRDRSPLSDNERRYNEWLDEVFDNPLPGVLQFFSPDHLEKVYAGRGSSEDDDRDDRRDRRDRRGNGRDRDRGSRYEEPRERPPLRRTRDNDDDYRPPARDRDDRGYDDERRETRTRNEDRPREREPERARDDDRRREPEDDRTRARDRGADDQRERPRGRDDDRPAERERDRRDEPRDEPREARRRERDDPPPREAEPEQRERPRRDRGRDDPPPRETRDDDRRRERPPQTETGRQIDDEIPSEAGRRGRGNGRRREAANGNGNGDGGRVRLDEEGDRPSGRSMDRIRERLDRSEGRRERE